MATGSYNRVEQWIAKNNPDVARRMYERRTRQTTTPSTPVSIQQQNITQPKKTATSTTAHPPGLVIPGPEDLTPVQPTVPPPVGVRPDQGSDTGTGTPGGRQEEPYTEPGYGGTHTPPGVIYTPPTPEETRQSQIEASGGIPSRSEQIDLLIQRGYTPDAAIHGYYPEQTIDISETPSEVQDLASKGWIITKEEKQVLSSPAALFTPSIFKLCPQTQTTYYASRPSTQQTFEYVYGKDRADVLTSAAFSKSFMGLETLGSAIQEYVTGDKKVRQAEQESLMEYSLTTQEYRQRYGATGGLIHSVSRSPAVQETAMLVGMEVGAPIFFSGAGKALSLIGKGSTRVSDLIGGASTRITRFSESLTPAGKTAFNKLIGTGRTIIETGRELKKPILETGRAFAKASGTRLGQATIIEDLYLVTEGPGLIETAKQRPERFGGRLTESLGLWGAMSTSILRGAKEFKIETQPHRTPPTAKQQDNILTGYIEKQKQKPYLEAQERMRKKKGTDTKLDTRIDWETERFNKELMKKEEPRITDWSKTDNIYRRTPTELDVTPTTKQNIGSLYNVQRDVPVLAEGTTPKGGITRNIQPKETVVQQYYAEQALMETPSAKKYLKYKKKLMTSHDPDIFTRELKPCTEPKPLTPKQYKKAYTELAGIDTKKFTRKKPPELQTGDISHKFRRQQKAMELTGGDINKEMKALNLESKPSDIKRKKWYGERRVETQTPNWLEQITEGKKPRKTIITKRGVNKRTARDLLESEEAITGLGSHTEETLQRRLQRPRYTGGELGKRRYQRLQDFNRKTEPGYRRVSSRKPGGDRYWGTKRISGTGELGAFATGTIGILRPRTDILTGRGITDEQKIHTEIFTDLAPRTDFFDETKQESDVLEDTDTGTISLTKTLTRQQQETRQEQRYITKTRLEQPTEDIIRRPRRTPPREPTPRPPTPTTIIPGLPGDEQQKQKKMTPTTSQTTGYIPQIHHRGRWINLTNKTLPPREAKNFLAETLDQSQAAVGRLQPSKGRLTSLGIKMKDYTSIRHKFKEKNNLIIEKREYRIDLPGEKKQITALGHAKNRLKGTRTRAGLNNTNYLGKQNNIRFQNKIKRTNRRQRNYV
jgi:hypothetical protein